MEKLMQNVTKLRTEQKQKQQQQPAAAAGNRTFSTRKSFSCAMEQSRKVRKREQPKHAAMNKRMTESVVVAWMGCGVMSKVMLRSAELVRGGTDFAPR